MAMTEWNILIVTQGGTVSLLKNLTEEVARQTMQRLTPPRMRPGAHTSNNQLYHCSDSDIKTLKAFGPEGVKLEVWPKAEAVA